MYSCCQTNAIAVENSVTNRKGEDKQGLDATKTSLVVQKQTTGGPASKNDTAQVGIVTNDDRAKSNEEIEEDTDRNGKGSFMATPEFTKEIDQIMSIFRRNATCKNSSSNPDLEQQNFDEMFNKNEVEEDEADCSSLVQTQRDVIITLANMKYNHKNSDHYQIYENLRSQLCHFLPYGTIKVLNVSKSCMKDLMTISSDRFRSLSQDDLFEKDCTEAIGF